MDRRQKMSLYEEPFLTAYCLILAFLLGSVFGSFLNCVSDRIIAHEKWWTGRSRCDVCGHTLGFLDLFPVFSYLFLKGRCRYCGARLSPAYVISEAGLGVLFVILTAVHGSLDLMLLRDLGFTACLYGLSLSDLKSYEIPDGFILFGIVWWFLFSFNVKGILAGVTIAGSILILSMIMDRVLKKESMGGGDIKLFFVVGLYLGFYGSLFNLILACVLGLLLVVILKKDRIPFGPAIALATYVSLLYGPQVVNWYIGLLGM